MYIVFKCFYFHVFIFRYGRNLYVLFFLKMLGLFVLLGHHCTVTKALEEARQRLNSGDPERVSHSDALFPPGMHEILETALPGEVRFVWQMQKTENEEEWINLPQVVSRCLDREYAKFACLTGATQKSMAHFCIHVGFGTEMRYSWIMEQSILQQVHFC